MRLLSILVACVAGLQGFSQSTYMLQADGVSDTYELISKAGYYTETSGNETPDDFMMHPEYQHISQIYDENLNKYVFAFDIHIDYKEGDTNVTDGNKGELVDRQRNEIKAMSNIPGTVAEQGETLTYRWKFLVPEGMKTTTEFCHIHQIKGMGSGSNVAHPVITFTCRSLSNGKQELQVINVPYEGAKNEYLGNIDLSKIMGKWIEADETFTVGERGEYHLVLTDVEKGEVILQIDEDDIAIWRDTDDNSTMRGKWGIYRSLGSDLKLKNELRSERILFADVESLKGSSSGSEDEEDEEGNGTGSEEDNGSENVEDETNALENIAGELSNGDDKYYDLNGRVVINPHGGIFIHKGKKILMR